MSEEEPERLSPWDRQPGETAKNFAAFRHYVTLGSRRSLREAAERAGRSLALFKKLSAEHNWVERAAAYDAAQAQEADAARRELRQKIVARLPDDMDRFQRLSVAMLQSALAPDPETGKPRADPNALLRAGVAVYGLSLKMLELPQAGLTEPQSGSGDSRSFVAEISDEELQDYLEELRRRTRGQEDQSTHQDEQPTEVTEDETAIRPQHRGSGAP